ncbi:hypothetical protein EYZ11_012000 [Aspergillus tanneri]|uniref:Secreted protein n=1 Tax=Aspergillus tanneri TaxID=1220188 RepID=A0A4S3J1D0_9EURO|nr:hypothetical protein EYZ11_012000 [Aspergillus tanneri]
MAQLVYKYWLLVLPWAALAWKYEVRDLVACVETFHTACRKAAAIPAVPILVNRLSFRLPLQIVGILGTVTTAENPGIQGGLNGSSVRSFVQGFPLLTIDTNLVISAHAENLYGKGDDFCRKE